MTFRWSAPPALIAAVVIVVAGLTFLSTRLFSGLTASVEQSQFQPMQSSDDDGKVLWSFGTTRRRRVISERLG